MLEDMTTVLQLAITRVNSASENDTCRDEWWQHLYCYLLSGILIIYPTRRVVCGWPARGVSFPLATRRCQMNLHQRVMILLPIELYQASSRIATIKVVIIRPTSRVQPFLLKMPIMITSRTSAWGRTWSARHPGSSFRWEIGENESCERCHQVTHTGRK